MTNPFEQIDARLSNIESLLLQIKHHPNEPIEAVAPKGRMYRVKAAAKFFGIEEATLYIMTSKKKIPFYNKDGHIFLFESDLELYKQEISLNNK